ncbi:MAG TPA: MerC domain-containing protein [Gemmatimonadaceae bacterium]|nr:MerC domain-containing protein [Gemmatimonadaceae bacterium]
MTGSAQPPRAQAQLTDAAGTLGAIVAALCCAGTPLIVAALTAAGLSGLRRDKILWPVMVVSLAIALWGYWQGHRIHKSWTPIILGLIGAVSLSLGVIVVHGFPAMQMIYAGAALLIAATAWNIVARRSCRLHVPPGNLAE